MAGAFVAVDGIDCRREYVSTSGSGDRFLPDCNPHVSVQVGEYVRMYGRTDGRTYVISHFLYGVFYNDYDQHHDP